LEWRFFKGILKKWQSFVLLTSPAVWNGGMLLPVPQESFPLLHRIQDSKHPLSINFFAEVRGARENGGIWKKQPDWKRSYPSPYAACSRSCCHGRPYPIAQEQVALQREAMERESSFGEKTRLDRR
jgi:hypothetical protein